MPRRISVKGKGADIFFGEYSPAQLVAPDTDGHAGQDPSLDSTASPTMPPEGGTGAQASNQARMQESKTASMLASVSTNDDGQVDAPDTLVDASVLPAVQQASMQESKKARRRSGSRSPVQSDKELVTNSETLSAIWPLISAKATVTNAFRYTSEELSLLEDVIYHISKQHGVKLSKQDIARLGLDFAISEYQKRGGESLIGELIERRKART
jgi:hypothetical protein